MHVTTTRTPSGRPGALALLSGTELSFAYVTLEPIDFASQVVRVMVVP